METVSVHRRLLPFLVAASLLIPLLDARPALAELTPESPEVQEAIKRGVHWLESAEDPRLGAKALVGLVMVKQGAPPNHPKIVAAVQAIQQLTRDTSDPQKIVEKTHHDNLTYSIGLSAVFLTSLDADQYQSDIKKLLQILEVLQKAHGGWGYSSKETGDTSMTQYAVLAMWEANRSGIDFPKAMVENVLDWLLRTQDPSGGFGYQGNIADNPTSLVAQTVVRPSLTGAGLGSVYACSDLLDLVSRKKDVLPSGVKEIPKEKSDSSSRFDIHTVNSTKVKGIRWLEAHHNLDGPFVHYYCYALERYWSFRESAENRLSKTSPWYSEIAGYLIRDQKEDGCWFGMCGLNAMTGSVPDTSFSLLFLLRSMKKSIEKARGYGPGLLVGGKGLPKGTAAIELRGGQVVAKPLSGPGQQLMAALENVESSEFDQAVETLAELPVDQARQLISANAAKFRELMQAPTPEARLAVVQTLANSDDMDNVPALIFALKDPDSSVVLAARDGLRHISRRFDVFGLPDEFDEAQRAEAIRRCKSWYLTIRPDAEFEN